MKKVVNKGPKVVNKGQKVVNKGQNVRKWVSVRANTWQRLTEQLIGFDKAASLSQENKYI